MGNEKEDGDSMDEMNSQNEQMSQSGSDKVAAVGKRAGNAIGKLGKKAVKAVVKLIVKLIAKLIALLGAAGIILIGLVAAVILICCIFNWMKEERGTSAQFAQDSVYENPTVMMEDGLLHAAALTEPQAVIDAYYKYMSSDSHTKYYNGKYYNFSKENQTHDFAGLMDYFERENYFYLSSPFIKMADELFHKSQFYYPEQLIQPVYHELEDGFVTAKPLVDHADETQNVIKVQSKQYNADMKTQNTSLEYGVWDWGLGSVLQYEKKEKDVYIECTYSSFEIDVDTVSWHYDSETESWYTTTAHKDVYSIPVTAADTASSLQTKIDAYADEPTEAGGASYDIVSATPSTDMLKTICDAGYNAHIPQQLEIIDQKIGKRDFDDANLKVFSNAPGYKPATTQPVLHPNELYYPINIPVIVSAATMSGNIKYRYNGIDKSEVGLSPGTGIAAGGGIITDSSMFGQWENDATDILVGAGCTKNLIAVRSGNICTELPLLEEEEDSPWGFDYIDDYSGLYSIYVPLGILEDLDFTKRITDDHTWDIIKELGLMQEYTGGGLEAVTSVNLSDVEVMARLIKAEAGHNMLDELMVGAVLVNRFYDKGGAYTYLQLISAPGQYACWDNGSFQSAQPSERDYKAAELVLSGEFAIPKNVLFQSQAILGTIWLTNLNNPAAYEGTHYYCLGYGDTIPALEDSFGRPAKTEAETRAWVDTLIQRYGGETEGSTVTTPALLLGDAAVAIELDEIYSDYKLYSIRNFDVIAATSNMQKMTDNDASVWGNGVIATIIRNALNDILQQIKDIFFKIQEAFPSNRTLDTERVLYHDLVPVADAHDSVFQAITFSNKVSYSEAADMLGTSDNLMFLFVGKEGSIGLGTGSMQMSMTPGTGTTIAGFVSPTAAYYAPTETYSDAHKYVVLAVPTGTVVQAVYDGVVTKVNYGTAPKGTSVTVSHTADGKTYVVTYGGLDTVSVTEGASVSGKQQLGATSSDGLYLDMTIDGTPVNPMDYFYQPVWSAGVPFADLLDASGNVDPAKIAQLREQLQAANNRPNTSVDHASGLTSWAGTYDKWHSPDYFSGLMWECPWWAWGRAMQYLESTGYPLKLPLFGDGKSYFSAPASYFQRGQTPRANSWVSWSGGSHGHGHVAYVEAVDADGQGFWISEGSSKYTAPAVKHVTKVREAGGYSWEAYTGGYSLNGFVYLDEPIGVR